MSFVDNLRMNNIFPSNGNNPLSLTPQNHGINSDEIAILLNKIAPILGAEKDKDRAFQEHMFDKAHNANLANIAHLAANNQNNQISDKPMNVFYKPGINDYQRETLRQGQEKIDTTRTTNSGKLAQGEEKLKLTDDQSQQKINLNRELGQQKVDNSNRNTDIRDDRSKIYAFKAMHPGMKIVATKGGNFSAIDPISGNAMDTGVATGSVSDEDKIKLTGEQRSNLEDKREINRGKLENQKQGNRKDLQDTKRLQPTQQRTQYYNRAEQLSREHPEYGIKLDPSTKSFSIDPSSDTFHQANFSIYSPAGDINLEKDDKSDNSKKLEDPLGIRPKSDDDQSDESDE